MDSAKRHQKADERYITADKEGKKFEYKPKGLDIVWGMDERFWKINDEAAEVLQVSWLEVTGKLHGKLKPQNTYKISFEISLEPGAFGWEGIQIYVMAKVNKNGKYMKQPFSPNEKEVSVEVKIDNAKDPTIYFGLYEVFTGVWKGGLKIHKAIVEEVGPKKEGN